MLSQCSSDHRLACLLFHHRSLPILFYSQTDAFFLLRMYNVLIDLFHDAGRMRRVRILFLFDLCCTLLCPKIISISDLHPSLPVSCLELPDIISCAVRGC